MLQGQRIKRLKRYKPSLFNYLSYSKDKKFIFIFNTKNGSLIQVPINYKSELSDILNNRPFIKNRYPEKLINLLINSGCIIIKNINEIEELKKIYYPLIKRPELYISIIPTLLCNLKCFYCFEKHQNIKMGKKERDAIIKFFKKLPDSLNTISIDWYGGEPLLMYDFIVQLQTRLLKITKSKSKQSNYSMTTNGYLLNPKISSKLYELGISNYQITIDGPELIHNKRRTDLSGKQTFATIIDNIKELVKYANVTIRVNVDKENAPYLTELIDQFILLGIANRVKLMFKAIVLAEGRDSGRRCLEMKKFSSLVQQVEEYAIKSGISLYVETNHISEFCPVDLYNQWIIGPDLSLYKCADLFDPEKEGVGKLLENGDIKLNDRINIWRSKNIFSDEKCLNCVYLPQCMGGCSLKKLIHQKDWCPEEKYNLGWYAQKLKFLSN